MTLVKNIGLKNTSLIKNVGLLKQKGLLAGQAIPFKSDLSLFYSGRDGLDITETKEDLPAKIIPACGRLDTSNYLIKDTSTFEPSATSGFVEGYIYYAGGATNQYLFSTTKGTVSNVYFFIRIASGKPQIVVRNASEFSNTYEADDAISVGWHKIKGLSTGSEYQIYIDDVLVGGTATYGANDGKWLDDVDDRNNITIGVFINLSSPVTASLQYISWVNVNDQYKWYITGEGNYCFDVIGGEHMTWVGSDHIHYDASASTHLLYNGFTKFYKAGEVFEYVPYKIDNTKYDASSFLTGYDELFTTDGTNYNLAPSVVDFDPTASVNIKLDVFDKSNSTIHIATGSMLYYDTAYKWRQDEISDPRIYTTYFNNTYEGLQFSGISTILDTGEYYVKLLNNIPIYATDKKGTNQYRVIIYYKSNVFVVYDGSGNPTTDVNGYIVMDI